MALPRILLLSLTFLSLIASSCSRYHLGTSTKLPFETLHIEPVKNNSFAPQVLATLTNQLANAFLTEGSVALELEQYADVSLSVTITNYTRNITAADETDTTLARAISLTLNATCSMVDNRTGKVYFNNVPFSASTTILDNKGFAQAEYQATPILARDLAKKIHQYVVLIW